MLSPQNARLPIAFIAGAIFLTGLVSGVGISYATYQTRLQQANETNASLITFTQTQSIMLAQTNQSGLEGPVRTNQSAALTVPLPLPVNLADAPAVVAPVLARPPATKSVAVQSKPAQIRLAANSKNTDAAPEPAQAMAVAAAPGAITMEQAGIAGMDTAGIHFKSGRQINVGSDFPTGEKLISVHPGEGRIVTDKRVINLIKPAAPQ